MEKEEKRLFSSFGVENNASELCKITIGFILSACNIPHTLKT